MSGQRPYTVAVKASLGYLVILQVSRGHTGEGKMGGSGFNEEEKLGEVLHVEGKMGVA